ncbi:MAG: hypothetical protein A4E53_04529 [Pelotomaculum sp. PtaB.Bin104]|nr:MAG: hypothetical protein A4E53_04529 [Pelotomaculum sp. PtaB.Bin104]
MPAALFAAITTILIIDMGVTLNCWVIKESIYPLNEVLPLSFGTFLAFQIWILKYTYGRFWIYAVTEVLLGFVFIFLVQPWLNLQGIWVQINATNFLAYLPVIPHFISVYLYQMWQEDALVPAMKKLFSPKLQTVATKPIYKDEDDPGSLPDRR